jgi:hypothetical protein
MGYVYIVVASYLKRKAIYSKIIIKIPQEVIKAIFPLM